MWLCAHALLHLSWGSEQYCAVLSAMEVPTTIRSPILYLVVIPNNHEQVNCSHIFLTMDRVPNAFFKENAFGHGCLPFSTCQQSCGCARTLGQDSVVTMMSARAVNLCLILVQAAAMD